MSVYKEKKDKKWKVEIRTVDSTGEAIRKRKSGFNTKKEAQNWENDFLQKIRSQSNMSFKSMYEIYMEDLKLKVKYSTLQRKKYIMKKHILPFFENIVVSEINTNHIRMFQNEILKKGLSKNSLRAIEGTLKSILIFATKYYNLANNPMDKVNSIGSRKNKNEFKIWKVEQFNKFLDSIESEQDILFFSLLFWTGIRIGEALSLYIKDINFKKKTLNINKTISRGEKGDIITTPKTESSLRTIGLTENLLHMFEEHIKTIYKPKPEQKIFEFGREYARKRFNKYTTLADLPMIRIHDLRHSHASFLIQQGINVLAISKRLGHEDIKITLSTYSHLYEEENERMLKILNNF